MLKIAPFSIILISGIIEKSVKFSATQNFTTPFLSLTNHSSATIRASVAYLFGFANTDEIIQPLLTLISYNDSFVRSVAIQSLLSIKRYVSDSFIDLTIRSLTSDFDIEVDSLIAEAKNLLDVQHEIL